MGNALEAKTVAAAKKSAEVPADETADADRRKQEAEKAFRKCAGEEERNGLEAKTVAAAKKTAEVSVDEKADADRRKQEAEKLKAVEGYEKAQEEYHKAVGSYNKKNNAKNAKAFIVALKNCREKVSKVFDSKSRNARTVIEYVEK